MEKLHLEDVLEDTPQTRNLLGVFERDAGVLRSYVLTLHRCCSRVLTAQRELCAATQFLSSHLKSYNQQQFPLDSDESILSTVLSQFAQYVDELSSVEQIASSQLSDAMMHPVNKFLQADLDELVSMKEMFQVASADEERALAAYMKYSRKREGEKVRQELNDELYVSRKKFHQTALHYFALLNTLQYKRKSSLLEPLIGFVQAQKTFFEMGNEVFARKELEDFLANISASVQGVHNELRNESQQRVEQLETIEKQSIHKYYAEVPEDMPYIPPNMELSQKAGYLFMRSKPSLLSSPRWDRSFFFIQGGNLMCQSRDELAGSLILDLNIETRVELAEVDDRRFVFLVTQPSTRKNLYLQAENVRQRDEWMATILNVVRDGQRLVSTEPLSPTVRTPTDSGFPHGLLSSLPVGIPKVVEALRGDAAGRGSHPATPPSTPADSTFIPDAPVQFELPPEQSAKYADIASKRINPFNETKDGNTDGAQLVGNASSPFCATFTVRFLGLQEVLMDRGEYLVRETIRQVMAARAIYNVFKLSEFQLVISSESLKLLDQVDSSVRLHVSLQHISYWAVHSENKRLFGFITRTATNTDTKFDCYVFECNNSGEEICQNLSAATQLAFQAFMQRKAVELESAKEKELLLANIQQLDALKLASRLSTDEQYALLASQSLQQPPAGSNSIDQSQQPPAGSNSIDQSQQPPAGSNNIDQSQQPPAGSNSIDQSQRPPAGSNNIDQSLQPVNGTTDIDQSQQPADGSSPPTSSDTNTTPVANAADAPAASAAAATEG